MSPAKMTSPGVEARIDNNDYSQLVIVEFQVPYILKPQNSTPKHISSCTYDPENITRIINTNTAFNELLNTIYISIDDHIYQLIPIAVL